MMTEFPDGTVFLAMRRAIDGERIPILLMLHKDT